MNGGPDESIQPGECPLCLVDVAQPTVQSDVIPILARHFGSSCEATRFTDPSTA